MALCKWTQLLLLGLVALYATPTIAVKGMVDQKKPTRSREAVRKATRLAVAGYQGPSTTKNATPRAQRKPLVEQKKPTRSERSVRIATKHALKGYQGPSTTKKRA